MVSAWVTFLLVSLLWGLVGGVGPFFIPSGPQKFLIQIILVMTAVCCWLHWFLCFLSQLNPLFGPLLSRESVNSVMWSWEDYQGLIKE